MRTLTATFYYSLNDGISQEEIELDGSENIESIIEQICLKENDLREGEGDEVTPKMIEVTDVSCNETTEYESLEKIFQFAEAYCECDQDGDVVEAALECDIEGSNIDEAYAGTYKSDSDFAVDMHEQTRSHEAKELENSWPFNCIDWEYAAKELMYDYSEHNGHYFRNL